jgi:hypothetical protein
VQISSATLPIMLTVRNVYFLGHGIQPQTCVKYYQLRDGLLLIFQQISVAQLVLISQQQEHADHALVVAVEEVNGDILIMVI